VGVLLHHRLANSDERDFHRVWLGQSMSRLGDSVSGTALLWWVRQTSGSDSTVFVVVLCAMVPALVAAPLAGVVVDRWSRKSVMLGCDTVRLVACVAIAIRIANSGSGVRDTAALIGVVAISAAAGVASTFFEPALGASVTMLVREERRMRANSMLGMNVAVADIAGSALGGVLVGSFGVAQAFWFDGATFAVSFAFIAASTIPRPSRAPATGGVPRPASAPGDRMWAGVALLRTDRQVRDLLVVASGLNIFVAPVGVLILAIAIGPLSLGAVGYGLLIGALSFGIIVGLVYAGRAAAKPSAFVAMMMVSVGLAAAVVWRSWPVTATAFAVAGIGIGVVNTILPTRFQAIVAPEVQGRVFATVGALSQVGRPVGLLGGVAVSSIVGMRATMAVCALGIGVVTLACRKTLVGATGSSTQTSPHS
jgi:MFS transporter, DHA3 family, macrolide efflux protein